MIFSLVQDFADALALMPKEHPRHRLLKLLDEAVRRDVHFIERHPTTFFQCMWNTCWWYDCPEAAKFYDPPTGGWSTTGPPWARVGLKICALLESWRQPKMHAELSPPWVRSLRPPEFPLGASAGQRAMISRRSRKIERAGFTESDMRLMGPSLGFSNDGLRLLSKGNDGVRAWDAQDGRELRLEKGDEMLALGSSYSPDSRRLFVLNEFDKSVVVREFPSNRVLARFERFKSVQGAAISRDGRRVAVACTVFVFVYEVDSGKEIALFKGHIGLVNCVAISSDGQHVVSGGKDGTVRVWEVDHKRELSCFRGHTAEVCSVAYSSDGFEIASGGGMGDSTVRVFFIPYDYLSLSVTWRGHVGIVWSLAFSESGEVASAGSDETIRIWDRATGSGEWGQEDCLPNLRDQKEGKAGMLVELSFSHDGRFIQEASPKEAKRFWDAENGMERSDPVEFTPADDPRSKVQCFSDRVETTLTGAGVRAWYPASLRQCVEQPGGLTCGGVAEFGSYLHLFHLEAIPEVMGNSSPQPAATE